MPVSSTKSINRLTAAMANANASLALVIPYDEPNFVEGRAARLRIVKTGGVRGEIIKQVRLLFKKDALQRELLVDLNEKCYSER